MSYYIFALTPLSCVNKYIYIYIYIYICMYICSTLYHSCRFYYQRMLKIFPDPESSAEDSRQFFRFQQQKRFHERQMSQCGNYVFLLLFCLTPPEPLREAIVGKSIYTCFIVKVCLIYHFSFLKLSFWIWFIVEWVS